MKKILLLLVMLLNIAFVSAAVDITETNKTQLMEPEDLTNISFSVTNTGAASITVSFTHNVDLEDDDGSKINLTLPGSQTINPGQTLVLQMTADVPSSQDFDEYIGTVTATASDSTTDSFQLTIDVQPIVCDSGIAGISLDISIEDPDDGEDIKPGDTISIDVDVENKGSDDIDVQVDAFLFNDEESVESSSSKAKNVDDGETEDFKLSLKVPTDAEELGEDERFRLYVKAFDDNNEDVECAQEFIELNLDLKDKDVVIADSSRIIPSSAVCGELASAQVTVVNIGDEEIDRAYITLRNSELRVNQRTDTFGIEEFTAQEENSVTRRLEFRIPNNAAEKTYQFEAEVNFDGGSSRETLSLTVDNCEASKIDTAFLEVKVDLFNFVLGC
ncbi:putative S-layer protein [Candidatus Woesearchaeota archaeon]|nr:putative S-layer protein [Candidatus Woesearchaeota archaeon]